MRKILEKKPRARIEFWTDRRCYKNVVKNTTEIGVKQGREEQNSNSLRFRHIRVLKLCAGKFHRYSGWTFKDYFINWPTTLKDLIIGNILGFFGFVFGLIQSFCRLFLKSNRPDAIFLKGGYVCLPVGLIAKLFKIPYLIHESDAAPGLTNRLLMNKAQVVALGINGELAKQDKTVFVGIPVAPEFKPTSESKQKTLKKTLGFNAEKPLAVITGGSQGSEHINEAIREILPELLKFTSVGLVAGRKHYNTMLDLKNKYENREKNNLKTGFRLWEYNSAMYELMGAADIVVSRAGATTIAELAALKKTVILIPFEKLPGSHQVKNADYLEKQDAVISVRDDRMVDQPGILLDRIRHLLHSPKHRQTLAENLQKNANPDAADKLSDIIIAIATKTDWRTE